MNRSTPKPESPAQGRPADPKRDDLLADMSTSRAPTVGSNNSTFDDQTFCFSSNPEAIQFLPAPYDTSGIQLIRRIAQGGSGEIWEAFQPQLKRIVAVKRLRRDNNDGDNKIRVRQHQELHFRQEALTTGYLEHPNILPVYDVIVGRDGEPMLIMKLVRGHLWNRLISDDYQRLPTVEFLARHCEILATVANAVAYAHSKSVIHRDLKPSQVMIGGFDEILLMDWGLAMAYERNQPCQCPTPGERAESPLYHPVNPAGTPTFMAPEQTLHTLDELGPWTDVYLLGGILYLLLCGRAPHWTASGKGLTVEDATRIPVQPPNEVAPAKREVPPPLAALAMACLSTDPSKRPESAQAFRLELLDWLATTSRRREADLIVKSIRASLQPQASPQTHHADYASLAERVSALDRAIALAPNHSEAIAIRERLIQQYARSAIAHNDLTLARVQATQLKDSHARQALIIEIDRLEHELQQQDQQYRAALTEATEARARTERLRAHAERTVRFLIHDLHKPLKAIGRLDLLRTAAEQAMRHFDAGDTDSTPPDPTIIHNRAIAFLNIGEVLSDEGDKEGAINAFQRAVAQLTQITGGAFGTVEYRWRVDLARAYDHLARQHYFLGHNQTCRDLCHQALALLEALIAEPPTGELSDRCLDIVQVNTRLGFAYWRDRQLDDALRHFNIALAIAQDEAARHPNTLPIEQALAHTLVGIGNIHRDRSEMDQAIAINERILRLRSRLSQTHPDNIPLLEDVFWTRNNLGLMYQLAGRLEEAEALLVSDIAERKAHSDAMPGSMVRLALRSFPLSLLAETRFLLGRIEDAWQTYRIAYEVDRHVADTDPSPHYQAGVAFSTARLAEVTLVLLAQPPHAQTGIIPPETGQSMPWPDHLANAERGASVATGATPYPDMSPQNPTEASAYNPRHQCPYPGSTVRAHTLADIRVLAHQALAAANGAHARTPTNAFYCKAKARALLLRGRLLQLDGQADPAHQAWHEALQLLQPIAPPQTDPATEELRAALHHCLGQHAQAQQSHPFLKTRRWFSPLVQQVAGIQV